MGFRFSLEALLKLTREKLDALREEISQMEQKLEDQRRRLEELQAQRQKWLSEVYEEAVREWDPKEMAYLEGYLRSMAERIQRQEAMLFELKGELSSKRAKALLLLQRLKLLEKTYERQHSEFLRLLKRREIKRLDLHNLDVKLPFAVE